LEANTAGADGGGGTTCGNCIFNPNNNGATWTDPNELFGPNYGACVQLLDPTHGTACAGAYENVNACNGVACDCETSDNGYLGCLTAEDQGDGGCATYAATQSSSCANDFADGGALATCSPGAATQTQNPDYTLIINLVCGNGTTDAGVLPGEDGGDGG
jgi:hypothetical protein